ncbi:MAG: hypothetical protein P8Z36_16315 [Gemmatimonadota bacterium]
MAEIDTREQTVLSPERRALLDEFDAGRRVALARVISVIENERNGYQAVLHTLHHRLGHAHRMGITGPPGAGKSTLSAALIQRLRQRDESVGVGVLLETVGVGQSELDIAATADTTIVVLVPESGDSIQTMKAGLMEAADLFVVNKADRPGADRLAHEVELMLHLRTGRALRGRAGHHGAAAAIFTDGRRPATGDPTDDGEGGGSGAAWSIPVLKTSAQTGEGVDELLAAVDTHRAWLQASGELARRRRRRMAERVRDVVRRTLMSIAWSDGQGARILDEAMADLEEGNTTPYAVAARIVRAVTG